MTLAPGSEIHFIGIGGSSMSGLARLMLMRGYKVTGSDRDDSHTAEHLREEGIPVVVGHKRETARKTDLVVFTSAVDQDNEELCAFRELGVPTVERHIFLGELSREYASLVAVCGTHGKTTATSMISQILIDTGLDPTVHIGGILPSINSNVRIGSPELFVTEADEFRSNFLSLHPTMAVFLNVDEDHMEFYRDIAHIEETFRLFRDRIRPGGLAILCADDARALALREDASCSVVTYGLKQENSPTYGAHGLVADELGNYSFTATKNGEDLGEIHLRVAGAHNAQNALAALAAACELGAPVDGIISSLSAFGGVSRRFELTGDTDGVRLYHDYGHNPAEYRTVVPLAAMLPHRKLFVVMQPHTYSRVKKLFDQYLTAFDGADTVLVTDIYAAREKDPGDIHATMLVDAMREAGVPVVYTPEFKDCKEYLETHWAPGDIVLTLGCGNINLLNEIL